MVSQPAREARSALCSPQRRALAQGPLVAFAVCVGLGVSAGAAAAQERTDFPPAARQRYEQGRDLQKKGQLQQAIRAFDEAIKLGMEAYPRVHLQRAASHLGLNQYDTAIAQYTKFLEDFSLEDSCRY
jgi:tetratricopeptide (TPR) repeat protein